VSAVSDTLSPCRFSSASASPLELVELSREDTVRLGFDLLERDSREPYRASQVAVLAEPVLPEGVSPKIGQAWQGAVKVRKTGKAKFELVSWSGIPRPLRSITHATTLPQPCRRLPGW